MGQHRAVPALVGVALLVAAAGAGAAATDDAREPAARAEDVPPYLAYAPGDRPTRVPREYVLTNATLAAWLRRTASPAKNAIIFTTTWVAPGATDELEMIRQAWLGPCPPGCSACSNLVPPLPPLCRAATFARTCTVWGCCATRSSSRSTMAAGKRSTREGCPWCWTAPFVSGKVF